MKIYYERTNLIEQNNSSISCFIIVEALKSLISLVPSKKANIVNIPIKLDYSELFSLL